VYWCGDFRKVSGVGVGWKAENNSQTIIFVGQDSVDVKCRLLEVCEVAGEVIVCVVVLLG